MADSLALTQPAADAPRSASWRRAIREAALRMSSHGEQPARHGAPAERRRCSCSRQWQPLEEVVGSALQAVRRRARRPAACSVRSPPDLPLVRVRRRADRARAGQPAGERGQVHAAGSADRDQRARRRRRGARDRVDDHGPGLPQGPRGSASSRSSTRGDAGERHAGRRASAWRSAAPSSRRTAAASSGRDAAPAAARASSFELPRGEPPRHRRARRRRRRAEPRHESNPTPRILVRRRRSARSAASCACRSSAKAARCIEADTRQARADRSRHAPARPGDRSTSACPTATAST